MKKLLATFGVAAAVCVASVPMQAASTLKDSFDKTMQAVRSHAMQQGRQWHHANPAMLKAPITTPDGALDYASSWGPLYTPEGEEWLYTVNLVQEDIWVDDPSLATGGYSYPTIGRANFVIYNAALQKVGSFEVALDRSNGETGINLVQIAPTLTKKFFNYNDNYEVMVYVHATTEDYMGHSYTKVFSLEKEGATFVADFEGNQVHAVNMAKDEWSEDFTITFLREEEEYDAASQTVKYYMCFDIYGKAGWGGSAQLKHTFKIDYELYAGAGEYALPLAIKSHKGKLYYVQPIYEKPFFIHNENYYGGEPDVTPDNTFLINLYDQNFNLVKTTKIPMGSRDGYLWSFPGLGLLSGNDDVTFAMFDDSDSMPCYIVGYENYVTSSDDFVTDLDVYDSDGHMIKSIVKEASDYLSMSDVPGFEKQFCFYIATDDESVFRLIDLPSGNVAGEIETMFDSDTFLSISFDRVQKGDSYEYVTSLNTADLDEQGNALHRFAWFKANGKFDHYQYVNLGNDVAVAQAYVHPSVFNPFLFNTDNMVEFMFLVKVYDNYTATSKTSEYFRLINENGDVLLVQGPDDSTGEKLISVYLMNADNKNAKLVVVYTNGEYGTSTAYSVRHFSLPLSKFAGGSGKASDPYHLATAGDVMSMGYEPTACFVLDNDIDFDGAYWSGNMVEFTGTLDGQGHAIKNCRFTGSGIFDAMMQGAEVKNLVIDQCSHTGNGGFVAGMLVGDSGKTSTISNVHVTNCVANTDSYMEFGGIVGRLSVFGEVVNCSVTNTDLSISTDAYIGGIAGEMMSGSKIKASLFTGSVKGEIVGGIVGGSISGDEQISNCKVNAEVVGSIIAGGIIGESKRTPIDHCYVEGEIEGSRAAAGIAAFVESYYEGVSSTNLVADNCIVNAKSIKSSGIAHRILGSTSIDRGEIDWDNVTPDMEYKDYPHLPGVLEKYVGSNYAVSPAAAIDESVSADLDTTEGKTIQANEIKTVAEAGGWAIGKEASAPWQIADNKLKLYFEDGANLGIGAVVADKAESMIKYDGRNISAQGKIRVFNAAGMLVAQGIDCIDAARLGKGVYVVVAGKSTAKISVK